MLPIELRVVEEVERFPAEIEAGVFADGEALEEAEVEVNAARQVQGVAPDVAEGEAGGDGERSRVVDRAVRTLSGILVGRESAVRIANQIGTRAGANAVADTGVVAKVGAIGHAEWRAGLSDGDAGDLPAAKQRVRQARALEERQAIDVADREVVAHDRSWNWRDSQRCRRH